MKIFYFILFLLVLLGVSSFLFIPTIKEARRSKIIENEISSLELEADKLDSENNFLREKIEYLKSDDYKESVAKDRLSLRNKGEKIVVVQPSTKVLGASTKDFESTNNGEVNSLNYQENSPNYIKWWNIVSGKIK